MALEWCDNPPSWMIQQAKEDLQKLEFEHPNRYKPLKQELKTFIANALAAESLHHLGSPATSISTQASTSIRKRKRCPQIQNANQNDAAQRTTNGATTTFAEQNLQTMEHQKRKSDDVAIERAEACLKKLRIMKDSFSI
ncbi:hypothetical protein MKW94_029617 [Papaver nudicaule]|uniref:Uncharacterized protein n=1 Tax=Papaver nudicaule TaxID=74823 RepID=A0AA41SB00_PAPNU|nr:hypothetical protein [Papaver nudicaule]